MNDTNQTRTERHGISETEAAKKLARAWTEFQSQHELSDDDLKLARSTGYTIAAMQEKLSDADFAEEVSIPARIREIHRRQNEKLAARREAIASGEILPPAKKKQKKAEKHDPLWAQAKQLCQLNMDDIPIPTKTDWYFAQWESPTARSLARLCFGSSKK